MAGPMGGVPLKHTLLICVATDTRPVISEHQQGHLYPLTVRNKLNQQIILKGKIQFRQLLCYISLWGDTYAHLALNLAMCRLAVNSH